MALAKCKYCNQRYRFELQHNKECWKRRAILKRSNVPAVQENRTDEVIEQNAIVEVLSIPENAKEIPIEYHTEEKTVVIPEKRKYTKKVK